MLSPDDLKYLAHVTDESFLVNSVPLLFKRIRPESRDHVDELFDEVLPHEKTWDRTILNAVAVNRPSKEIQDRYGTRNPIDLIISISWIETQRKGWTLHYQDMVEYPGMDGQMDNYGIEQLMHDGMFRDTDGNEHPVSYTILLTNDKVNTA